MKTPIDPKITGKYEGYSRQVWKELAQREEHRDAVKNYQVELKKKISTGQMPFGCCSTNFIVLTLFPLSWAIYLVFLHNFHEFVHLH
jgi:hypothetical protein